MRAAGNNHAFAFMEPAVCSELQTSVLARADHPMTVAHIIPPVRSVTPVMKIAVSNRVSSQLSGMVRLNVGLSRSSVASIY
jgi:hypothetical protein